MKPLTEIKYYENLISGDGSRKGAMTWVEGRGRDGQEETEQETLAD
jgi:hypothetical protein